MLLFLLLVMGPLYTLLAFGFFAEKGIFLFPHPVLLPSNQHVLIVVGVLTAIEIIGIIISLRILRQGSLQQFALLCGIGLIGALCCFSVVFTRPEADLTRSSFVQSHLFITVGETVTFVNSADGVRQVLCIGLNQQCFSTPTEHPSLLLEEELTLLPGQNRSVVFPQAGRYTITSKTTPMMNITIDVNIRSDYAFSGGVDRTWLNWSEPNQITESRYQPYGIDCW